MESLPTVGGTVGLIFALYYIGRLALDWRRGRAADHLKTPASKAEVADALIDDLRESLRDERETNFRLSGQIEELQTQNALANQRLRDQRRAYEEELNVLRDRLAEASEKLVQVKSDFDALQARLQQDDGG